jgi:predicted transcriptional regulator
VTALVLEILQLLASEPRQTPQSISNKLGASISSVKAVLQYHYEVGHVKRVAHGLYEITELGKYVLQKNVGR